MSDTSGSAEPPSEPAPGWERHELEQLRRLAKLSFPEKLAWLEQAHRLAKQLGQDREGPPISRS